MYVNKVLWERSCVHILVCVSRPFPAAWALLRRWVREQMALKLDTVYYGTGLPSQS